MLALNAIPVQICLTRHLLPGADVISMSAYVLAYALVGTMFAGLFAGVGSLLFLSRLNLGQVIYTRLRNGTLRGSRLRELFVVAQTASLRELLRVDPDFRVVSVSTASTSFAGTLDMQAPAARANMERILIGIRNIPGVEVAGATTDVPFSS